MVKKILRNSFLFTPFIIFYRKIRDKIWAVNNLPKEIHIRDIIIPCHNWNMGKVLKSDTSKIIDNQWIYEEEDSDLFKKICNGKEMFFDVGSQIGYYSFLAISQNVKKQFLLKYCLLIISLKIKLSNITILSQK